MKIFGKVPCDYTHDIDSTCVNGVRIENSYIPLLLKCTSGPEHEMFAHITYIIKFRLNVNCDGTLTFGPSLHLHPYVVSASSKRS